MATSAMIAAIARASGFLDAADKMPVMKPRRPFHTIYTPRPLKSDQNPALALKCAVVALNDVVTGCVCNMFVSGSTGLGVPSSLYAGGSSCGSTVLIGTYVVADGDSTMQRVVMRCPNVYEIQNMRREKPMTVTMKTSAASVGTSWTSSLSPAPLLWASVSHILVDLVDRRR